MGRWRNKVTRAAISSSTKFLFKQFPSFSLLIWFFRRRMKTSFAFKKSKERNGKKYINSCQLLYRFFFISILCFVLVCSSLGRPCVRSRVPLCGEGETLLPCSHPRRSFIHSLLNINIPLAIYFQSHVVVLDSKKFLLPSYKLSNRLNVWQGKNRTKRERRNI